MNEKKPTLFYGFHKDISDFDKLIPKEYKSRPLQCEILEENSHHWIFRTMDSKLTFTVVKFPKDARMKFLPPFKTAAQTQDYLSSNIPTHDKDGHRM